MPSAFFTYFMCCIQEELLKGFLYITFFFFKKNTILIPEV